jgi:hypothetical protein
MLNYRRVNCPKSVVFKALIFDPYPLQTTHGFWKICGSCSKKNSPSVEIENQGSQDMPWALIRDDFLMIFHARICLCWFISRLAVGFLVYRTSWMGLWHVRHQLERLKWWLQGLTLCLDDLLVKWSTSQQQGEPAPSHQPLRRSRPKAERREWGMGWCSYFFPVYFTSILWITKIYRTYMNLYYRPWLGIFSGIWFHFWLQFCPRNHFFYLPWDMWSTFRLECAPSSGCNTWEIPVWYREIFGGCHFPTKIGLHHPKALIFDLFWPIAIACYSHFKKIWNS